MQQAISKQEIAAVLQCVSALGIHSMSLWAPILLEELAAHERRDPTTTVER